MESYETGDEEAAVASAHPGVSIRPTRRPGLSLYVGHEQLRRLVCEAARGELRITWGELLETSPGVVEGVGVVRDLDEQPRGTRRCRVVVRDGLVAIVDSYMVEGT